MGQHQPNYGEEKWGSTTDSEWRWLQDHLESKRSREPAPSMLACSGRHVLSAGKVLERLIRKAAVALHDYQVAKLWKIPTDLRITAGGLATYGEEMPADFLGHTVSGRAVMIEAKQHNSPRLPIGSKGGVTPYQWTSLLECHKAGGIALIVWQNGDQVCTMDMDMAQALSADRRSIPWHGIPAKFIHEIDNTSHLELFEPYMVIMRG